MINPHSTNNYPHNLDNIDQQFDDYSINLKRYLSLFLSNWYWFAAALFIALSFAYGINRYSEKVYTVSSTMLIKDDMVGGGLSGAESFIPGGDYFKSKQNIRNELGILKSFSLNLRVIENLPEFHIVYVEVGRRNIVERMLYDESPFIVFPEAGKRQSTGVQVFVHILSESSCRIEINGSYKIERELEFGELFQEGGFAFRIKSRFPDKSIYNPESSSKYYFRFASTQSLANQYRQRLIIEPIEEEASIVKLTLTGSVAQQEADYLNKLMEIYINQGLEFKNQTADSTIKFIDLQLGMISDSLSIAEDNLEKFRRSNKLIDLSSEAGIIQNKFERYGIEKTGLELQKKYYEYLQAYLTSKNETGDLISPSVMGVNDPQLLRIVPELAQLQKQKKFLALNLNNETGPLTLLEEDIERTKSALKETIDEGLKNIESTLSDVNVRLTEVDSKVSRLPATERQMVTIQRKFDINNSVYTYLLEKRAEAGIAKASNVSDNKIIDRAYLFNSSIVKPQKRQNYLMALILGFLFPIIGIILIDYFNNRIIDKRDIEKVTKAPVIGFISHNNLQTEIPVSEKPGSTLAESFRSVRTNLKYFMKETQNPVISVSSTVSSEGKTFISANLAAIIASNGKKVLLVGLDLRKPRIHKIFGINNDTGLSNYLIGQEKYEKIIFPTEVENLWYAPSGPVPPNPAELIDSEEMKTFINKAKKQFDYIVIDTPPVALVTDALLVSSFTDLYLFVVRQRYSSKNTLELIEDLRKNGSIKSLGIVINDISLSGYYGYGLRYGYSAGYGYYYGYNYYGQGKYGKYGYKDKTGGYYTED